MEINLYTGTIVPMMRTLENLSAILDKAAAFADTKKTAKRDFVEPLLNDRLVFDQFPLIKQVQLASDCAKGAAARLSKQDPPSMADTEKTVAELKERIEKTLAFMRGVKPESVIGNESVVITMAANFKAQYGTDTLNGFDYTVKYAIPNFYFHVTTAYAILRKNGVPLGKNDFLGPL